MVPHLVLHDELQAQTLQGFRLSKVTWAENYHRLMIFLSEKTLTA